MKTNNRQIKLGLRFIKENHVNDIYLKALFSCNLTLKDAFNNIENYNNIYDCDDLFFTFNVKVYSLLIYNLIPRFKGFMTVQYKIEDYFFKKKVIYKQAIKIFNFIEAYNDELTSEIKRIFNYSNVNDLSETLFEIELKQNNIEAINSLVLEYYKQNKDKYKENLDGFFASCYYYVQKINQLVYNN